MRTSANRHFRPIFHPFSSIFFLSFSFWPNHILTKNYAFWEIPSPLTRLTVIWLIFMGDNFMKKCDHLFWPKLCVFFVNFFFTFFFPGTPCFHQNLEFLAVPFTQSELGRNLPLVRRQKTMTSFFRRNFRHFWDFSISDLQLAPFVDETTKKKLKLPTLPWKLKNPNFA